MLNQVNEESKSSQKETLVEDLNELDIENDDEEDMFSGINKDGSQEDVQKARKSFTNEDDFKSKEEEEHKKIENIDDDDEEELNESSSQEVKAGVVNPVVHL